MGNLLEQMGIAGADNFLVGGGEMGRLIREMDWSQTPLGPIESWPQSLRTTISLCLASDFPISIAWGPRRTQIYNDGYRPICGAKHPYSMGLDFKECWFSAWPAIGEAFERASAGESAFIVNRRMFLDRYGYLEETFFTFSFSPIRDESGGVGGLFHPVTEMTQQTLAERRLKALRDLADRTAEAKTIVSACELIMRTLSEHELDLPFSLFYLLDADGERAILMGASRLAAGSPARPEVVDLSRPTQHSWPLAVAASDRRPAQVDNVVELFGNLECGPYPETPHTALILPITVSGLRRPFGLLVAAVSPRRALDDAYRAFYLLLRDAVTNAITNARAHEEESKRAEALAAIDRAKTVFFSNVSHEFRTPLSLLLGPIEDTLADPGLQAEHRERLEVAHRNSLRLLKLVNTLLNFSRIEAERIQASYEPTDLAAYTADLASVFRSTIERAGLRLKIDCPTLAEPTYVDREMWEKIVLNLLSNAFKFTFEGEIEVSLRQTDETVTLNVRDTGVGIPVAELPHIFERFHRVKGARGRSFEGSGIGLALVQELVRLHSGTVRVESEVDRGSLFAVSIPTGMSHLPSDHIHVARTLASTGLGTEAYVQEMNRWSVTEDYGIEGRDDSETIEHGDDVILSKAVPRILLADDNSDMRDYVRRLLSRSYEVVAVADGRAALEAARAALEAARGRAFDLVLTDVMMPRLDGFGLLRELRTDERTKTIPVILLSARAGEESRVDGMKAGADDYLVKPFSARELLARVEGHLKLHRVRCEAERAVRESEERFRQMADHAPVMVWVTESDASCSYLNKYWYEFTGQTPETGLGFGWLDATHPDDCESAKEIFIRSNKRREAFRLEYRIRRHDGVYRWAIDSAAPRIGPNGEFLGFIGSVIDITDRKLMEEALKESDRRKDEFLAMLAHELRNPLAPIRNAAEALKLIGPADPNLQWTREVIERQTQHLTRLVDDLLDVSRITRGKVTLARELLDMATVVNRAVEMSRPVMAARRHRLTVTLPQAPLIVKGDLTRLVQVVDNLLNNAAKYTDEGGRLLIEATREDAEAVLRIRDDGIGLTPELLPRIFDLFTQADRSLDRSQGGLGIGLTLVRNLVEMHGGRVEAKSAGPNQGSEFIVRLPVADAREIVGVTESADVGGPRLRGKLRVLVVEDNLDSAEMLAFILKLRGHELRVVYDGTEALVAAKAFRPHVVLCDIGLPRLNGYEVAEWLRSQPDFKHTRLIALTGYGQDEDRLRASNAGFDFHLTKPVEPMALGALLDLMSAGE